MYQGHKSVAAWNVAVYLLNDSSLYSLCKEALASTRNRGEAVAWLLERLPSKTPDGYAYTKTTVKAALVGFGK